MKCPSDTELINIWCWLKANDIPNWIVFVFTVIIWPSVLFCWNRRKVNSVPNLEVSLQRSSININGNQHPAINFTFKNNTGQIVYLSNARILKCSKLFNIPTDASRGIGSNSYELLFFDLQTNQYKHPQYILQTGASVTTSIAVTQQLSNDFYSYSASRLRQFIRFRKYFVVEYTIMLSGKGLRVSTIY